MKFKQHRGKILIGLGAAAIVVVVAIIVSQLLGQKKPDPYKQVAQSNDTSSQQSNKDDDSDSKSGTTDADADSDGNSNSNSSTKSETPDATKLDPATISTIDIAPMGITVSYVKGVGGFEYSVKRTADGTNYVDFSSPDLVGTKCTNDTGVIVSIIQSPSSTDSSTISKTVTVDGVKYGLSLSGTSCTANVDLLKKYQASFSNAFSLLKKTTT